MRPSALGLDGWSVHNMRAMLPLLMQWLGALLRPVEVSGQWLQVLPRPVPKEGLLGAPLFRVPELHGHSEHLARNASPYGNKGYSGRSTHPLSATF